MLNNGLYQRFLDITKKIQTHSHDVTLVLRSVVPVTMDARRVRIGVNLSAKVRALIDAHSRRSMRDSFYGIFGRPK